MRWDYGTVYKSIRKSKGLTQKEVCGDELARSTVAKIEANQATPNYENMEFLLRQIDMTFGEFEYICNYYQPNPRNEFLLRFQNLLTVSSTEGMEPLIKDIESYLAREHDIPLEHVLSILKVSLSMRQSGLSGYSQSLAETIWQEMKDYDTWYLSDLRRLSCILHLFSTEALVTITPKILKSLEKYELYEGKNAPKIAFLVNLSTLYLHRSCLGECEQLSEELLLLSKEKKQYHIWAMAKVRLGICRKDEGLLDEGLELLRVLGEEALLADLKEEKECFFQLE